MKKTIVHNGFTFNLSIELFTMVERHPDGKRVHTLTAELPGDPPPFKKMYPINDNNLIADIDAVVVSIKEWADKQHEGVEASKTQQALTASGWQ